MTIGTSIVLIAIGAILKYALTDEADVGFINLDVVGTILMIVGIIGLILSLLYTFLWAERARDRDRVVEREYPADYPGEGPPRRRF